MVIITENGTTGNATGKKATGPIVNRALSGLSSLRVNKLFGNGIQTDGCLIPHNRLGMMSQYRDYPTDLQMALQKGAN